jgi:hypothetical protein
MLILVKSTSLYDEKNEPKRYGMLQSISSSSVTPSDSELKTFQPLISRYEIDENVLLCQELFSYLSFTTKEKLIAICKVIANL